MKRTLIIAVIAVVLIAAIAGTCFALYSSAPENKTVTIGAGEAVVLGIGEISQGDLDDFLGVTGETGLKPGNNVVLPLQLTATNPGKAEDGVCGLFTVTIAPADSENAADVALAAAIDLNSTGTYADLSTMPAKTKAQLTAGVQIDLDNIPTDLELTFSVAASAFPAAAEGKVTVTISWIIDTTTQWAVNANAYYVNGIYGGTAKWAPTSSSFVLSETPNAGDCAKGTFTFAAGDKIKCAKGNNSYWYDWTDISVGDYHLDGEGNLIFDTAGSYTIFLKEENYVNKAYIEKNV